MEFEQRTCVRFANETNTYSNTGEEIRICRIMEQSIKNVIKKENYISFQICHNPISTNGGNFLGDLTEVDIKGKTKDGVKELNIFVKHIVPETGIIEGMVNVDACYKRETFMYAELQNIFDELYNEVGIPNSERLRKAHCYDCNSHVIILDNLSRKGFKVLNRFNLMPLDFAEAAIRELAKFHALSFILQQKRPDYFEKEIKTLKISYTLIEENDIIIDKWNKSIRSSIEKSFECVNQNDQSIKEYIIEEAIKTFPKHLTGKMGLVKCICHGDYRMNNILLRKNIDGEIETIIVDYQMVSFGSPIVDILHFLYTGTDREFRKNHMDNLKDLYHKTMTRHLEMFDLDISKIYPRSVFEKDFKENLLYGLFITLYALRLCLTDEPEIMKTDTNMTSAKVNDVYKVRVNETIEEYMEWGIL
ncbi:unnamed protein product, partial [Brenthis ino]